MNAESKSDVSLPSSIQVDRANVRIPVSPVPERSDRMNTVATGILAATLAGPVLALCFASMIGPAMSWVV